MKLKMQIARFGNTVVCRILEQEGFKGGTTYDYGNIRLRTSYCPYITGKIIYLRGNGKLHDNDYFGKSFTSIEFAKDFVEDLKEAITKINSRPELNTPTFSPDSFDIIGG